MEDFERSVRDGDELDVSLIHEHEVSTLKRSLETAMTEREAMKTTFEEDLARLNSQVEEKENQRKQASRGHVICGCVDHLSSVYVTRQVA